MDDKERETAQAISFIVFNAVNNLNDRAKLHMDIEQATDLANDWIELLMNEHSKAAVIKYLRSCVEVK